MGMVNGYLVVSFVLPSLLLRLITFPYTHLSCECPVNCTFVKSDKFFLFHGSLIIRICSLSILNVNPLLIIYFPKFSPVLSNFEVLQEFFVIQKFIDSAFLLLFVLSRFSVMGFCFLYLKKAFCMS